MNEETNGNRRANGLPPRPPAFKIDAYVRLELEANLAIELGDLIVEHGGDNKAMFALGKQLQSLGD